MPRYRPYFENKESGVQWLGAVPAHWEVDRAKWSVKSCRNGVWGEDPDGVDDLICIRVADFDRTDLAVRLDKLTFRAISEKERSGRLLLRGDLLIEKSGGGDQQLVGVVVEYRHDIPAVTSNFIARMPIADYMYSRYFAYVHSHLYSGRVNYRSIKQTTGIQNLDSQSYLDELIPYPPLDEQRSIARFLDHKTAQIDALIAKKQILLQKLAEKRTALISHAVTKGLDPNAKMKESGVEWLGQVPEHCEVKKIKYSVTFIGSGKTPRGGAEVYVDDGIMLLRSQNVYDDGLRLNDVVFMTDEADAAQSGTRVKPDDVLLNITGASIGRTSVVPKNFPPANVNQHVCILRPNQSIVLPEYLHLLLCSMQAKDQIVSSENGTSREGLNFQQVARLLFSFPSLDEQRRILDAANAMISRLELMGQKVNSAIEKLKEYRSALITQTVTGKIDVRNVKIPQATAKGQAA